MFVMQNKRPVFAYDSVRAQFVSDEMSSSLATGTGLTFMQVKLFCFGRCGHTGIVCQCWYTYCMSAGTSSELASSFNLFCTCCCTLLNVLLHPAEREEAHHRSKGPRTYLHASMLACATPWEVQIAELAPLTKDDAHLLKVHGNQRLFVL